MTLARPLVLKPVRDRPAPEAPAVSVVVPVRDGGARFQALLAALGRQEEVGPVEVVVVDSGSRDGSLEAAARAGARTFAVDPAAFHHSRVRNAAVAASRAGLVCLFSQDAVPVGTRCLSELARSVRADPRVAGAYARQLPRPDADPFTAETIRAWTPPGPPEVRSLPDRATWEVMAPRQRVDLARFDDVASCIRRADWEAVPLPDVPFGEDAAWAREVLLRGRAIAYAPGAVVEHSHRPSFTSLRERNRRGHRLLAERFGLVAVPGLAHVPLAWLSGVPARVRTGRRARPGSTVAALALAARACWLDLGSLLGQWEGARDARDAAVGGGA